MADQKKQNGWAISSIRNDHARKPGNDVHYPQYFKSRRVYLVQTTLGIPAVFQLNMPDRESQTCKVMWRDDTKLGVLFR